MAKGLSKSAHAKGQKSITAFFGGGKSKHDTDPQAVDESSDVDMVPETTKSASDSTELPPIHDIPTIFSDLVSRVPQIEDVAKHLQGRKLRVATMCSGTESPLLALDLIRRSILEQHDINLEVDHVFSCEIEPFKQAYIERNFRPPILFRDVCELGDTHATTAYGALVPVPGDVDMLIAGTSCVDYSNLNNEKQDIDANGESGRTFRGMMSWVENHRPPLVILENVCSAPWQRVADRFRKCGYSAEFLRVDTKQFYIPHTRTRVYLFAVDQKRSSLPGQWKDRLNELKRPASSSLDAFLLPSDDPRIHQAREKLISVADRRNSRTDWGKCESRHQRARLEEELGSKRPLTSWDEGGSCKLPDFAWNDWGVGQVERVWDLMDISLLRSAKKGVDPSYKTQVWNLSQNVDRTIGSSKVGICPCLTPSMIPYITNRGGPMVGLEALSMQGLPIDELLLTRETEDQLADLAGNAMSTTVVGGCILAALVVARKLLKDGSDQETYEQKKDMTVDEDNDIVQGAVMDVDSSTENVVSVEDGITGEDQLVEKPLDLAATSQQSFASLLADAEKSARLCECEGRKDITERPLNRCADCGSSSCVKCGGRPEHNLSPIDTVINPRISPSTFAKELKSTLPMSLELANVSQDLLDSLRGQTGVDIPKKRWSAWSAAVLRAVEQPLRFVEPKRQEIWIAIYQSPVAHLELLLHPKQPEWRLFAKPKDSEPAHSELRRLLESPVGRFVCVGGLFSGRWDFALPHATAVSITIEGSNPVPSWEARLGLQGEDFKNRMVHSRLEVTIPDDDLEKFDRDISGVYVLLDKCGTANSALHKKLPAAKDESLPPLFMFLDPTRGGDAQDDFFVFSTSKRRYEFGETRPIICHLESKWRQSDLEGSQDIRCLIPFLWTASPDVCLVPSKGQKATFSVPGESLEIDVSQDACRRSNALLVCRVPLHSQAGSEWPKGVWKEVDKIHERATFKALAWLIERVKNVDDHFGGWQTTDLSEDHSKCERCAPTTPQIRWTRNKKRIVAMEDTVEAGEYERALKRRPAPFVTQLKLEESGLGTVRIGVNIASLMHRALSRLPSTDRAAQPTLSWRLNTDFTPIAKLSLPKFKLSSNRRDPEHAQPPSFKIPLRIEQLRSLGWMLKQESPDAPPFMEEEISEAILEPLGWRAEGRAERPFHIRGGVLADEVGYGKTAITLGLIDCTAKDVKKEFAKMEEMEGKVPVKATLVIVPPHLTRQWGSEVKKFTGNRFKVVILSTAVNLNSLSIADIQDADIVVAACNLFHSSVYLANLEAFAAGGSLPAQDGRYFNTRLATTLASLRTQVELLKNEGATRVMEEIKEARKRDENDDNLFVPTKRLKGKSYRDAAEVVEPKKTKTAPAKAIPHNGLIMEVIVPSVTKRKASSSHTSPATSAAEASEDEEADSEAPRARKRRTTKKTKIIFSDEETQSGSDFEPDEDEDEPKTEIRRAGKVTYTKRTSKPSSASSDCEEDSAEETEDGMDVDGSDEDVPSKKGKGKGKGKGKAKAKSVLNTGRKGRRNTTSGSEAATDDNMDIDEPAPSKSKAKLKPSASSKKRKSSGEEDDIDERPAVKKQKRREDTDPWKLRSTAVKRDWTQMQSPPLEMFHFARKVVDEYTYLDGKIHSVVTKLTAERHWVLSGTPPVHDFAALKTISAFLGLHLGVDDDGEGQSVQVKKRRREQTAVEEFHSFREVHSLEWHAHRHQLGQAFLDRFVRQNIAEIDEIPSSQNLEKVDLPAAERAIYLELEHHLRALDMTVKRGKKSESDREKRLAQALGESSTAEEALLKRCSHFDLETSDKGNAMKACEVIVEERKKQLENCRIELLKKLEDALKAEKKIGKTGEESMFQEYVRVSRTEGVGDKEATAAVQALLDDAKVPVVSNKIGDTKSKGKGKGKDDQQLSNTVKEQIWSHREQTHEIRRLTKELVGRFRSLRYFTVVRDLQKQNEKPPAVPCPACGRDAIPVEEIAVLSSCGHMGCLSCVMRCAEREECVYAAQGACRAAARVLNVVKGDTLGVDDEARYGKGKHFGLKLEKVIHLIKKRIPSDERVLIFVQFPDLMKKVGEALTANHVKYLEIKGTATQKSKNLEKFQTDSEERVLLLNVMDESASGANLTSANHAVFLSPLLAQSQEIYDACETQAIGRLRRYGQTKHVHIWRFLSTNTIDMEIYEQRARTKV